MIEKIGPVRNPLTVIAIFAGVVEISGTVVLPHVSADHQGSYTWFLILFPVVLILLFFLTLNFNYRVLYAPSDFKSDENFLRLFGHSSNVERVEKIQAEVREIEEEPEPVTLPVQDSKSPTPIVMDGETWSRYLLSEDLVLSKLSAELGRPINRGLRFSVPNGPRFIFDGAVIEGNKLTIIEVKVTKDPIVALGRLSNSLTRIFRMFPELPQETRENFAVILAIVSQKEGIDKDHIATKLRGLIGPTPAPLQVRIFTFDELSKDSHAASQV